MKVIVLIITYNGANWLHKCLNSLKESVLPVEVVVVDNGSSDETLEIVREFDVLRLFALQENLGFGKANNVGIRYALEASADYLFLLNQDAWIYPDTISRLVEASQRNPEYYVLSPLHLEGTETTLDLNFKHYIGPPNCKDLLSDLDSKSGKLRDVYETSFVNAALWLLPKACLTQIGGFDPIFAHYGEDNDFTKRVRYHGYKVGVCPNAIGVHDRAQRNDFAAGAYLSKTLKKRKTDALIKLKNINLPFPSVLLDFYSKSLKSAVKCALKFNLQELSKELKIIGFASQKLMAVHEHRKVSAQPEAAVKWLPAIPNKQASRN